MTLDGCNYGGHPAFHCAVCGHHIGVRTLHMILATYDVVCSRCANDLNLHDRFYPHCPDPRHDIWDHPTCAAAGRWDAAQARAGGVLG